MTSTAQLSPARLSLITGPAAELFASTDAIVGSFLRVDSTDDASLIDLNLAAARKYFERMTGLSLVNQTWRVYYDGVSGSTRSVAQGGSPLWNSPFSWLGCCVGREIQFPRAPLVSIGQVQYINEAGTLTTFDSANYTAGEVGVSTAFGRLWLDDDADWPSFGNFPGALQIQFTSGFGASASNVPEDIRMAVLQLAAHWYENRLPVAQAPANELPFALQSLIEMHRVAFLG